MARISEQTTQLLSDQATIDGKISEILSAIKDSSSTSNVSNELDEIKNKLQEIVSVQNEILTKANAIQQIL